VTDQAEAEAAPPGRWHTTADRAERRPQPQPGTGAARRLRRRFASYASPAEWPFEVADERRAELGVGRQAGVVGCQAHQGGEPKALLSGDIQVAVARQHGG
jgi:hypothetical protein